MEPKFNIKNYEILSTKKYNDDVKSIIKKILNYLNSFDSMLNSEKIPESFKKKISDVVIEYEEKIKNGIEIRNKLKNDLKTFDKEFMFQLPIFFNELQLFSKNIKDDLKTFENDKINKINEEEKKELKLIISEKKKKIDRIVELLPNYMKDRENKINKNILKKEKIKRQKNAKKIKNKKIIGAVNKTVEKLNIINPVAYVENPIKNIVNKISNAKDIIKKKITNTKDKIKNYANEKLKRDKNIKIE